MTVRESLDKNFFVHFAVVVVGGTIVGGLIFYLFLLVAVPGLRYVFRELLLGGWLVGLLMAAVAVVLTYRQVNAIYVISRLLARGRPLPADFADRAREAAFRLPLRILYLTLSLWPLAILILGLALWRWGILHPRDALRGASCGLLYCPIQALILFHATRQSMRRMGAALWRSGLEWFDSRQGGLDVNRKLIASFVVLAVFPLLAGVVVTDVQREWIEVKTNLRGVCDSLEEVHAAAPGDHLEPETWRTAITQVTAARASLPPGAIFKITQADGSRIQGSFDPDAIKPWRIEVRRDQPAEGCLRMPVPGERRFVVMRFFSDPGVWVGAVVNPYPEIPPFWSKFGATLVMVAFVSLMSALMGYLAARDVGAPLEDLKTTALQAAGGNYRQTGGFLPDDELGELAFAVNAVIGSFERELARSSEVVDKVREVMSGLGFVTSRLRELADRQRDVINEHGSLADQAGGSASKVTQAAEEIKERARLTHSRMVEVSGSARESNDLTRKVLSVIEAVATDSERIWDEMQQLEHNYRRMEEVVEIIDDVAERTEILALNASLEAGGRSDDEGHRFQVVASEVQRLSERITVQTVSIGRLFKDLRGTSMAMAQAIEEGRDHAREGPRWIGQLTEVLGAIDSRAASASSSMREIASMTETQSEALSKMNFMVSEIQSLAKVIDEGATGAEDAVGTLDEYAVRLRKLVEQDEEDGAPF